MKIVDGLITRHVILDGYYGYRSSNGSLVFDRCAGDAAHLLVPTPDQDRRRCRVYAEDLLPAETRGQRGRWEVTITFRPETE